MNFLKLENIKKQLTGIGVQESSLILSAIQIESIKHHIELNPPEELRKGNCLVNAFRVAENTKADIVEGVAYIKVEKDEIQSKTIIKHAWNSFNDNHFDITKDFVWPNFSVELVSIEYYIVGSFPLNEYNTDGKTIEFKTNADLIASSLRYLKTRDIILSVLNSFGLDEKYYEQLLKECIVEVKKDIHKL